jgi:hypothetical protein
MEPVELTTLAVVPHQPDIVPRVSAVALMFVGATCFLLAVVLGFLSDVCSLAGRSAYDLSEGGHG